MDRLRGRGLSPEGAAVKRLRALLELFKLLFVTPPDVHGTRCRYGSCVCCHAPGRGTRR